MGGEISYGILKLKSKKSSEIPLTWKIFKLFPITQDTPNKVLLTASRTKKGSLCFIQVIPDIVKNLLIVRWIALFYYWNVRFQKGEILMVICHRLIVEELLQKPIVGVLS